MRKHRSLCLMLALTALVGCALVVAWLSHSRPNPNEATRPEDPVSRAVREHVLASDGWSPDVYTVENTNRRDEKGNLIVNVIHRDDRDAVTPGDGKSLQLRLDPQTYRIIETLHFQ